MGNRRIICFLLAGIGVCAALLWGAQRRARFFPAESKTQAMLFEHPLDTAESVVLERGDVRMELRRQADRWALHAPFPACVDQGVVSRMMDAFENAHVTDALSFQELRRRELSQKEFGLSPCAVRVVLRGLQWQDEVRFGALSPMGNEVYLQMNQMDQVLVLPASLSEVLPRTADDLRSRKLLHGDRTLLRTIELRAPGRPFIKLSKESGTWWLVQPASAPASDEKVEALLDALYDARVVRFTWPTVSNVMDVAESDAALKARLELYGVGTDAAVQVHVQEALSTASAKIAFGRPLDDADTLSYVLLPGGDAIGVVSNGVAAALHVLPSDLRDTRLFFDKPDGVRRLQILYGDMLFVLVQTNAVWQMLSPVADVADQPVTKNSVEQLLRMKASKIVDDVSGDAPAVVGERGPPISNVELTSEQSSLRFAVTADDYEGHFYRVTFTNSPTVFLVASSNMPTALTSMSGLLGLRDKTVLAVPASSLRRITVRRATGECVTLQRTGEASVWRLGEGIGGKVDPSRLDAWISHVIALKADRIEKLGLSLEDIDLYGLRSPWLEVSLDVDADDAVRKTVLVGKDAGFGKRYAMVRGLDVLFVLGEATLRVLASQVVDAL